MSKYKLIITEKPSVAQNIASALNVKKREKGFFIGNNYIISWCIGHLISLASADEYDPKYKTWNKEDLPILPSQMKYVENKSTADQNKIIKELMNSEDITEVINACDAGREGELIFRLVYSYNKCNKPIKRLWISSLEEASIISGINNLSEGSEYENLYKSALCRQNADWIVGINATRLFSGNYDVVLNIGRVMSPTLALIVNRDDAIQNFTKEPFYTIECEVDGFAFSHNIGKIKEKDEAEAVLNNLKNEPLVVTNIESKNKSTAPPKLFDLTTLQREANKLYGYTAQKTLDVAQKLYEKKLITYPRTDSRFLSSDMQDSLISIARTLDITYDEINPSSVINNAKVTDHHAIIPTIKPCVELEEDESNIYKLVSVRFVSAMSPKYEYSETVLTIGDFTGKAKMTIKNGFKDVESLLRSFNTSEKPLPLPKLEIDKTLENAVLQIKKGETTPPKPYTEDTLLSAMENINNADFDSDVERKGLGTPATRASIIEKLVTTKFIERKEKSLIPTTKGSLLIKILPQSLKSPTLTAEWENNLKEIERGVKSDNEFIIEISNFITEIILENKTADDELYKLFTREKREKIGVCPVCSNEVIENKVAHSCKNKSCNFAIFKENKYFKAIGFKPTKEDIKEFLKTGKCYAKLYSKAKKKEYNAWIIMKQCEKYTEFEMKFK